MNWTRACGYIWLAFVLIWLAAAFTSKRTTRRETLSSGIVYRFLAVLASLLLFSPRFSVGFLGERFRPSSNQLDAAGFALTLAGLLFAVWARFFLGRNWSAIVTLKEDHELIQSGPYALVRHPIYAGFSLAALGTAIAIGQWKGLLALPLYIVAWRIKWGVEESFMAEQFGDRYAAYKRHVHALIPGVW